MNYCVIINTYKRGLDLVERSLRAALKQSVIPKQIILIDQNQPSLELSNEIKNSLLFSHQKVHFSSVSEARNSALYPNEVEWIVFCDDDGYMDDHYSEILKNSLTQNPTVKIIAGAIIRDDNFDFYTPRQALAQDINKFQNTKLLMGSNFAVKREVFEQLGKFDTRFGAGSFWGSGEETDFAWKAYFKNVPMLYEKKLIVYHIKPYFGSLEDAKIKAYRYGIGKGALVHKWLIKNRQIIVLYEVAEMFGVPLLKILKGSLTLDKREVLTACFSSFGRLAGFIKSIKNS